MKKNVSIIFTLLISVIFGNSCNQQSDEKSRIETEINEYMEAAYKSYLDRSPDMAGSYCNAAIRTDSSNWKPYTLKGLMEFEHESYSKAIGFYETADSLNLQKLTLHFSNGDSITYEESLNCMTLSYAMEGYREKALSTAKRLINSTDAVYLINYIYTVREQEQYVTLEERLGKLSDTDLEYLNKCSELAALVGSEGDTVQAICLFEECLKIDPYDAWTLYNLSNLYQFINHPRAIELKKKAAAFGNLKAINWLKENRNNL